MNAKLNKASTPISTAAASALLGVLAAFALGSLASASPTAALVLCATSITLLVFLLLLSRAGFVLAIAMPLLLAGLFVPLTLAATAELAVMLLAITLVVRAIFHEDPAYPAALAALAVTGFWLLLTLHPNVPSLSVGLLGARKTAFAFVGLTVGLLWPRGSSEEIERLIVRMLCIAGIAALLVHLFLPEVETSFARSASKYTEMFAGQARMSGFFAGPFHIGLLGSFLVLCGWHSYLARSNSRVIALLCILTGSLLVIFANVRTGYIAVAVGIVATLLLRLGPGRSRLQIATLTVLAIAAGTIFFSSSNTDNRAISSIPHLTSDSRVKNRVTSIHEAERLIGDSPLIGWGAGSAGSTLNEAFSSGRHVTSHDMALGVLVEGGIIGLLVVVLPFVLFSRVARDTRSLDHPAAAAVIALAVFGLTGDVSEALPISLFLLILIGLRGRTDPAQRHL